MRSAAAPDLDQSQPGMKLSFWDRFMAWWDGYDLPAEGRPNPALRKASHDVRYEAEKQQWETIRLKLVQDLWGEGYATPGGAEHVLNMTKFFALDPSMSVVDLGAGLGGATRVMCENFGVWVNGYEADQHLAEAAMAMSVKAGMGKRASIAPFEPESMDLKPNSADCVFSKEFLFTLKDKSDFLRNVEMIMKSRGQFLFTDYMLAEPHLHSRSLDTWIDNEPNGAHPWAAEDYKQALAELHMDIRVIEDITDSFHKLVTTGWAVFLKSAAAAGLTPEAYPALTAEAELWARRMGAIEAGDLKVCRVHVLKRDTARLMSSW